MELIAHSRKGISQTEYQPLYDHLHATAELAKQNASAFERTSLPYSIGLLHDLGKASAEFQKRILENGSKVDHSMYGALKAIALNKILGRIAAYCIAGHHAGLPDATHLDERVFNKDSLPQVDSEKIAQFGLDPIDLRSEFIETYGRELDGFSRSFFIRMLYSALVDADYLDTESFMKPELGFRRMHGYDLTPMIAQVENHIAGLGNADLPINAIRKQVLEDCRSKSSCKKGFFTLPVPTGGGKTLTSLLFALDHAVFHGLERIIYVIPYTSIIEQNSEVIRRCIGSENVLEHHSNRDPMRGRTAGEADPDSESMQELASENWDAPVIVTTNVQFFESLFANRSSRCRKLHRISNSVIILDEAQMLPTDFLKPCMHALEELTARYGCSVVLSTATQPVLFETPGLVRRPAQPIGLVKAPTELYEALQRVEAKFIDLLPDSDLAPILMEHEQVLCIVNTRRHAARLFDLVQTAGDCWHLSANMCAEHRSAAIAEIRTALKQGRPCRVISTQLVEAGVDLDFPVVYRSLSGIDSIVQSAGRCNREGRLEKGRLFVFDSGEDEPIKGWLKRMADIGAEVIRNHSDFLSPEAVRH